MKKKRIWKKILIIIVSIFLVPVLVVTILQTISLITPPMKPIEYESEPVNYWPTETWKMSSPEAQGMDSTKLLEMVEYYNEIQMENPKIMIDSITIVRNGYIVLDMYFNPLFSSEDMHITHSVTKSIMSSLVGIAIDKGYIDSSDSKVIDILDDYKIDNMDERWNMLTVEHLLSMQTGLNSKDSSTYGYSGLDAMQKTNDWTEYILKSEFEADPGQRFEYSNMSSFLLSAIIKESTGMDTLEFARKNLFSPLGINDVKWEKSPQGIDIGWARMWLKPHDMAKIGLLYLQKGHWDGEQVISSEWIDETITAHSQPKKYRKVFNAENEWDFSMSTGEFIANSFMHPFADGYGYQFWLDKSGIFAAFGTGGQYIIVNPDNNLVVVFTCKMSGEGAFFPEKLFNKYILKSIVSDSAIQENKDSYEKLSALSAPPKLNQQAHSVGDIPPIAFEISGKSYTMDENYWNYDNFRFLFDSQQDYAEFIFDERNDSSVTYKIGLDGTYRFTETNGSTYAAVGQWDDEKTFTFTVEVVGYSTIDTWRVSFEGESIQVEEISVTGTQLYKGTIVK